MISCTFLSVARYNHTKQTDAVTRGSFPKEGIE